MRALLTLLALGACTESAPTPAEADVCAEASSRSGALECLQRVPSAEAWQSLSVPLQAVDQVRATKYLVPLRAGARLPPLLMNGTRHELHYDFLVEVFPDRFPTLTPKGYIRLLFAPGEREFLAGTVTEYRIAEGGTQLGFTLPDDPQQPGTIGCEDLQLVHDQLAPRLPNADLYAVPTDRNQLDSFASCAVPWLDPTAIEYESYHRAIAFGTVRLFEATELSLAIERAEVGFQDLVVVDQAPSDIETVVSGVVTGSRQGPLSHVAVRSAARGTPNCYLEGALGYFSDFEGQLVRLECAARELLVSPATQAEAEQYWQTIRPAPVALPEPDRDFTDLVPLEALALDAADQRALATTRFGAKGRNLAWLRQNMEPAYTPRGFLVPLAHYLHFIEANTWQVDLGDGPAPHTFAETLTAWHADPTFTTDAALRRERLRALQAAMEAAPCDSTLVDAIGEQLTLNFGDTQTTARFRSSSNAEDGAFFNGAGLYDSYSGCHADDTDQDEQGPSLCDPGEAKERTVCRALRKVWASLHNPKAYDERAFYGIDPARVAMGVLVNERSEAELANMVAFSGNPSVRTDDRYLVNAQIDELPVVSPTPGIWPEQTLLTLDAASGAVSTIDRVSGSSMLEPHETVLTDAQLSELGAQLARLTTLYPFDAEPPPGRTFLLDTEWKLLPDRTLRIKQVRPFLR